MNYEHFSVVLSKLSYGGGSEVEVLACEDMDSELSDEEKHSERVDVPGIKSDIYGGENCQCCCHDTEDQAYATRSKHCVPCGMKVSLCVRPPL